MTEPQRAFFYRVSHDVRITVRPRYLPAQSRPAGNQFVFAYFVRIENVGARAAQLVARRWRIHDSVGEDTEVEGAGVVGEQPMVCPGQVHEYRSFCVLKSADGFMEGHYRFVRVDGTSFDAEIPRFVLHADLSAGPAD